MSCQQQIAGTKSAAASAEARMEVRDGLILGIYNYCDRWCETCRFTSRCRVFADCAKREAMDSPELKLLSDTPPHPSDVRPSNGWLEEILSQIDQTKLDEVPGSPPMPARLMRVVALSQAYCDHAWVALESEKDKSSRPTEDPYSIIMWFAPLIASKTHRALTGLHEFDGDREFPPDHEGSAKVALIGIDRSMGAWVTARDLGRVSADEASRFIAELHRLCFDLEELIPKAREFVRPGFDEPDEVSKLEATDWS
jgi:hypothetical protein